MIGFILGLLLGIVLTLVLANFKSLQIRYYKLRSENALTKANASLAQGDKVGLDKWNAEKAKFDAKIAALEAKK
jgi:hypothetical protein